jgi:hypothetical protein
MNVSRLLPLLMSATGLLVHAQDYSGTVLARGATSTGAGMVEMSVSPSGVFTAAVHWDGVTYRRKSHLDTNGHGALTLDGGARVEFSRAEDEGAIHGSIFHAGTAHAFRLARAAEPGANTAPAKGKFTSFIEAPPPGMDGVFFDGDGSVAIQVAKPSRVQRGRFAGRMPDGEPFLAGSKYGEGRFPVFSKLYKRKKKFLGSVTSDYEYELIPDPDFPDRFFSDVAWQKQAGTSETYYPAAISRDIVTESFKFFRDPVTKLPFFDPPAPPAGEGAQLEVILSGGDLPAPVTRTMFYRPGKPISVVGNGDLRMKIKIDAFAGKFSGSFHYPAIEMPFPRNVTKTKFSGVIQILANQGRAVFRGPSHSGKVVLRLKP